MRVVLVGKNSGMTLKTLDALAARHEVVGLVESAPRGKDARGPLRRAASAVRHRLAGPLPLERWARTRRVPFLRLARGPVGALDELLRSAAPDLLVVASLSQLLPEATVAIPRLGAINLHPSLLPRYPGPFPILWQYLEFERTFGVTVHRIDAREDAGDILEQEPFDVAPGTPLPEVLDRSAAIGARLAAKAVDDLDAGRAEPRPQAGPRGPRARAVRRDEPLVDWERWPIERVWHVMIGTAPWLDPLPGWRAGSYERTAASGAPGTVGRDEAGWYARHPEGKIRLVAAPGGTA
jgi:methionyl-tRNA formyltransferase